MALDGAGKREDGTMTQSAITAAIATYLARGGKVTQGRTLWADGARRSYLVKEA